MFLRNRKIQLILIAATLLTGLASRKLPGLFHPFFAEYLGDTLWALLVFYLLGFVFVGKPSAKLAVATLAFSYLIEFSQLYHANWIVSIRQTTLGALVLGHGFLYSDLICYTIGIVFGYLTELILWQHSFSANHSN
jgi:hypothetical protein